MYFSPSRTLTYLRSLLDPQNGIVRSSASSSSPSPSLLLALIPDFLTLYPCAEILRAHQSSHPDPHPESSSSSTPPSFLLGAQDCFWASEGAYTGEVSPQSIRSIGASIVELGHAERRSIFGETDSQVSAKASAACANGLIPLVCIGEITPPHSSTSSGEGGGRDPISAAVSECRNQITPILDAIPDSAPVIFAYEPVWAIGQPVPAGVDHVSGVVGGIRDVIGARVGEVRVLYGGSAGPGLWADAGLGRSVDGMFLGRFAHEIEGVRKVVREVEGTLQ